MARGRNKKTQDTQHSRNSGQRGQKLQDWRTKEENDWEGKEKTVK